MAKFLKLLSNDTSSYARVLSSSAYTSGTSTIQIGAKFKLQDKTSAGSQEAWHCPLFYWGYDTSAGNGYTLEFMHYGINLLNPSGTSILSYWNTFDANEFGPWTEKTISISHNRTTGEITIVVDGLEITGPNSAAQNGGTANRIYDTTRYTGRVGFACHISEVDFDDITGFAPETFESVNTGSYNVQNNVIGSYYLSTTGAAVTVESSAVAGLSAASSVVASASASLTTSQASGAQNRWLHMVAEEPNGNCVMLSNSTYSGGTVSIGGTFTLESKTSNISKEVYHVPSLLFAFDTVAANSYYVQFMHFGLQIFAPGAVEIGAYWFNMEPSQNEFGPWSPHTAVVTHNATTGEITVTLDGDELVGPNSGPFNGGTAYRVYSTARTSGRLGFGNLLSDATWDDITGNFPENFNTASLGSVSSPNTVGSYYAYSTGGTNGSVTVEGIAAAAQFDAAVSSTATASAGLTTSIRTAAGVSAIASATAALTNAIRFAATPSVASSASATTLVTALRLEAAPSVTADAAASLTSQIKLAGSATSGEASALAGLMAAPLFYATASAVASANANLNLKAQLEAEVMSLTESSATLTVLKPLDATASAESQASADLSTLSFQYISAEVVSLAEATGDLQIFKRFQSIAEVETSASADLMAAPMFFGGAEAQASSEASFEAFRPLYADAYVESSAGSALTTGIVLSAEGIAASSAEGNLDTALHLAGSAVAEAMSSATSMLVSIRLSAEVGATTFASAYFGEFVPPPVEIATIPAAVRCVLLEVGVKSGGIETTRYLSNMPYTTQDGEVPANTVYEAAIVGGVKFTESISVESDSFSLSYGDIEIDNTTGERDSWLSDIWANRSIKVFIGDVSWSREQFLQIFDGVVATIDSKRYDKVNLKLTDKMQRLNHPMTEAKLGGETQNKDRLLPLCFGEVHNIEPLLVSAGLHEYQVHDGPIERIIEVRDNGVPVSFDAYLTTGKFRLKAAPAGTITCSVQGDKSPTYANDVATLIQRVVTRFGHATRRFSGEDINLTNFGEFSAANQQPVGLYLPDRTNVLDCVNKLATSVGARLVMAREGKLSLVKLALPRESLGTTVGPQDMVERSIAVAAMIPVQAAVKLGYCRNYAVQDNLETGIPSDHIDLYAQEWLTVTRKDSAAAADYVMHTEPDMRETLLLREVDAIAEANRRLNLFSTQRKVVKYTGFANLMGERLGSSHTVQHHRFGLSAGSTGQIVSLSTDWLAAKVEVEVFL